MESLFKREEGILKLARVAKNSEIKSGKIRNQRVFVIVKDLEDEDSHARFFHFNRVGKKVYKTIKEKIKISPPKKQILKPENNLQNSIKLEDTLSKETYEKLMNLKKGF